MYCYVECNQYGSASCCVVLSSQNQNQECARISICFLTFYACYGSRRSTLCRLQLQSSPHASLPTSRTNVGTKSVGIPPQPLGMSRQGKCARGWLVASTRGSRCAQMSDAFAARHRHRAGECQGIRVQVAPPQPSALYTMRAELIGHFKPCMTEIDLHT